MAKRAKKTKEAELEIVDDIFMVEKAWKISRRILVTSVVQLGGFNK